MIITPKLMLILGVGTYRIAWIANIYMIASGLIVPVSGYLGDRLGMKKLFIWALIVYTFGSFLCAIANNLDILLVARCVQALGGGLLFPVSNAIILRIVPPKRLGSAMGVRGIAVSVAPAIGPLLGAYLTDRLGWHSVFMINVPIGLIMIPLVYYMLPDIGGYEEPSMDWIGLFFSSIMLFSCLLAISEGQKAGWASLYIVTLFTISFFFTVLFIIWELRTKNPMLDLRLLKNVFFSTSMFVAVVATIGMYAAIYFIPFFAENLLHFTLIKTGMMLLPAGIVMGIATIVGGFLFDRIGALPLCLTGIAVAAIITIKTSYITTNVSFSALTWLLVERAMGLGLALFPLSIAALYTVPRRLAGRAAAINSIMRMVPAAMGLAYFTYILNKQEIVHYDHMAWHLNTYSAASQLTRQRIMGLAGLGRVAAPQLRQVFVMLEYLEIQAQSMARSIDDVLFVSAIFLLAALPFTLYLSKRNMEKARAKEESRLAQSG